MADEAMSKYGTSTLLFKTTGGPVVTDNKRRGSDDDFFKKSSFDMNAPKKQESNSLEENNKSSAIQYITENNQEDRHTPIGQKISLKEQAEAENLGSVNITGALSAWANEDTTSRNSPRPEIKINTDSNLNKALNLGNIQKSSTINNNENSENSKQTAEEEAKLAMEASINSLNSNSSNLVVLNKQSSSSSKSSGIGIGAKKTGGKMGSKKIGGKKKMGGRLGGAKAKVDMSKLEEQAQKEIESGVKVQQQPLVSLSSSTNKSASTNSNKSSDRLGMAGGRGLRTINHGSTFTTIEQREPSNISGPASFFDETNNNNLETNNQQSQVSQMSHQESYNSQNSQNDTFSGIAPIDAGHGNRSNGIGFGSVARSNTSNNNNSKMNTNDQNGSIWGNRSNTAQPISQSSYKSDAEKLNSMRNKNAVSSSDLWDDHRIANTDSKDYIDNGTSCSSKYNTNSNNNNDMNNRYNMSDMGDQIEDIRDAAMDATTRLGSLLGSAVSNGMDRLRNSNY